MIEQGRVCIKKFGRDSGDKAVVTKVIDSNFVSIVTSTRTRERKCNVKHLEFLSEKVNTDSTEQLAKALEIEPSRLSGETKQKKDPDKKAGSKK